MNYNRMSVSQNALVIVNMTSINGGDPIGASDTDGFVQQTNPFGLGAKVKARCLNNTGGSLSGQCIWYD